MEAQFLTSVNHDPGRNGCTEHILTTHNTWTQVSPETLHIPVIIVFRYVMTAEYKSQTQIRGKTTHI